MNGRIKLAALVLLIGSVVAYADGYRDVPKPDLKLELSIGPETICAGSKLPLKMKITNQSERAVRIFKLSLWHTTFFEHTDTNGKSVKGTLFLDGDRRKVGLPENIIMLEPKDSYITTRESTEFSSEGKHKLSAYYGGVSSNDIEFEVAICN